MSLLLQALKKAEEDKRRRAEMSASEAVEPTSSEVQFPELNLAVDEPITPELSPLEPLTPPSAEFTSTAGSDWDFVAMEEGSDSAQSGSSSLADALTTSESIVPAGSLVDVAIEGDDTMTQALNSAPHVEDPTLNSAPEVPPVVATATPAVAPSAAEAPAVAPVAQVLAPQQLAKSLFAKSQQRPTRGLLPWLLLGAGLLLAGMVAWFAWQYQQLTQAIPKVEVRTPTAPVPAVASEVNQESSGYISEAIINQDSGGDTSSDGAGVQPAIQPQIVAVPAKNPAPARSSAAAKGTIDSAALNPPLKFVRQPPVLATPDPVLLAWQFYQQGELDQAEVFYRKALQADPRQRDALLGLAAIAQQRGEVDTASAVYQRILRANPQDESAKAGLLALNATQMPEHEALQLEQSGQSNPMILGQYFAAQQRWGQAQEQFFLAYSANPNSADAALNLAVSLDHLQQKNLAKTYYRQALQAKESIHFDRSKVEQRLVELEATTGATP